MKIEFRKLENIDKWIMYENGEKTNFSLTKENFGSSVYYLLKQGERVKRRYESIEECKADVKIMYLDKAADKILGV